MTSLATGIAKGDDTSTVAREAAEAALAKLGDQPVGLSIVYASSKYDYQAAIDAVRDVTGGAPLVGCSTGGEFTEHAVEKESIAVGLIASESMAFHTMLGTGVGANPIDTMSSIWSALPHDDDDYPYLTALMFVDGLAGKGEEVTLWASNIFSPNVKFMGGAAGDDLKFETTHVFVDDTVATDAVGVCLIQSKQPFYGAVAHGHEPLSEELTVTKAEDNILYEVNDRPAWEVWQEHTRDAAKTIGIDVDTLTDPSAVGSFLIRYELGLDTGDDEYKIRVPLSKNDDGSLNFACTIPNGATFRIMKSEQPKQIASAKRAATMAKASAGEYDLAGVLVFDCVCRGIILDDQFPSAVDQFKNQFGDVPLLGWETYGEICMEPGQFSGFHNTTSVVLMIPK